MSDEDFFDSFKPVPPGEGEHYWTTTGSAARCTRCGLRLVPRLTQLQVGYVPTVALEVADSGERWPSPKHRRCAS